MHHYVYEVRSQRDIHSHHTEHVTDYVKVHCYFKTIFTCNIGFVSVEICAEIIYKICQAGNTVR